MQIYNGRRRMHSLMHISVWKQKFVWTAIFGQTYNPKFKCMTFLIKVHSIKMFSENMNFYSAFKRNIRFESYVFKMHGSIKKKNFYKIYSGKSPEKKIQHTTSLSVFISFLLYFSMKDVMLILCILIFNLFSYDVC